MADAADVAGVAGVADLAGVAQVVDALSVAESFRPPFAVSVPALLTQLYNARVASDVKLTLMNAYPDDFQVGFWLWCRV